MLRDHLADEARHSRFFSEVFHYLWLTLNSRQRAFVARTLLETLATFFEVDEQWLHQSLRRAGIGEGAIKEILDSLTNEQASRQRARSGAVAYACRTRKGRIFRYPTTVNFSPRQD
jgi:molybdopterin-biosynthesis enzyme MoeA-like protein